MYLFVFAIVSRVTSTLSFDIVILDGLFFLQIVYVCSLVGVLTSNSNSITVVPPVILLTIRSFLISRSGSPNIAKYNPSAIVDLPIALRLSGLSLF